MGLGGLGVSLAGFAGLITTLDRRPEARSPIAAWRIRNIVTSGLILTVAGFGIVALYTATGESLDTTVRAISLLLATVKAIQIPREGRRGPEWPSETNRRIAVGSGLLVILLLLLNVWLGRVGFLQILFVVLLIDPISIFIRTVMDVASSTPSSTGADAGEAPTTNP